MDLSSTSSNWIYAYKAGSALNSDSVSASIEQHDEYGTFNAQSCYRNRRQRQCESVHYCYIDFYHRSELHEQYNELNNGYGRLYDGITSTDYYGWDGGTRNHGCNYIFALVSLWLHRHARFQLQRPHLAARGHPSLGLSLSTCAHGNWRLDCRQQWGGLCHYSDICCFMLTEIDDGCASHRWPRRSLRIVLPAIPGHRSPRPIQA